MRGDTNRRLTILTEAEKTALYDLPVFDDFQRLEFFAMTDAERSLAMQRRGIVKQVYCLLQIGYFKAKQAFFQFTLEDVPPEDITFILQRYFPGQILTAFPLLISEYTSSAKKSWRCLDIVFVQLTTCRCYSLKRNDSLRQT